MNIQTVSVSVTRTISLPGYSNAKYSLALQAELEQGDNAQRVADCLRDEAAAFVEEQCDRALEAEGEPAKFYQGPRYTVVGWEVVNRVLILPDESDVKDLPGRTHTITRRARLSIARYMAQQYARERRVQFSGADDEWTADGEDLHQKALDIIRASDSVAVLNLGFVEESKQTIRRLAIVPAIWIQEAGRSLSRYEIYPDEATARAWIADLEDGRYNYKPQIVMVPHVQALCDLLDEVPENILF